MAYDTDKLYKKAIEVIKEKELYFMADVYAYLGISKPTFYDHFPVDSNRFNEIKELVQKDRIKSHSAKRVKAEVKDNGNGYIYIVKCGDFNLYKIGISKSKPKIRLSALQAGCPFPLTMTHIFYCTHYSLVEHEIHKRYDEFNEMGEWFKLTDQQLLCVISDIEQQSRKQLGLF